MGLGVSQNYPEALIWFEKSANQGHVEAQYNIGMMYYQGLGAPKNADIARKWLMLAEKQGDQLATKQLTEMDAFHQFNAALDNSTNTSPKTNAGKSKDASTNRTKASGNQETYSVSKSNDYIQKQNKIAPIEEIVIQEQPITAAELNRIAQKEKALSAKSNISYESVQNTATNEVPAKKSRQGARQKSGVNVQPAIVDEPAIPQTELQDNNLVVNEPISVPTAANKTKPAKKTSQNTNDARDIAAKSPNIDTQNIAVDTQAVKSVDNKTNQPETSMQSVPADIVQATKPAEVKISTINIQALPPAKELPRAKVKETTIAADTNPVVLPQISNLQNQMPPKKLETATIPAQTQAIAETQKLETDPLPAPTQAIADVSQNTEKNPVENTPQQQTVANATLPHASHTEAHYPEGHLPKLFHTMFAFTVAVIFCLLVAIFMGMRIRTLVKSNRRYEQEHINTKFHLNNFRERSYKLQEELNQYEEKLNGERQKTELEIRRADALEALGNKNNSRLVEGIKKLETEFELDPRLMLLAKDIETETLWEIHHEVNGLVIARLETEQKINAELQQVYKAVSTRLGEKETLLDMLKSQMDTQANDFENLRKHTGLQIASLQQQLETTENALANSKEESTIAQENYQLELAKHAEKNAILEALQTQVEAQTARMELILQDHNQQNVLLQQQHSQQISSLQQEHNQQITTLQQQQESNQREFSEKIAQLEVHIAGFLAEEAKQAQREEAIINQQFQLERFSNMELELNQQLTTLQQQLDNTQRELSETLANLEAQKTVNQTEQANLTATETMIRELQTRIDSETNGFNTIGQEQKQQIITLQQQLDSTQGVLSDTLEKYQAVQQTYQAEVIKRAEKEAFLEALQLRIDAQTGQFAKMELELKEQKTMLQQQMDNTQRVLSDTLEKNQPVQISFEDEQAKRAEKDALFDTLQAIMDTQNNQFAKLEQELENQQAILQQQQDNIQKVLTDNQDVEAGRTDLEEFESKPSFFDLLVTEVGVRFSNLFGAGK
jgi:hypothetical protein